MRKECKKERKLPPNCTFSYFTDLWQQTVPNVYLKNWPLLSKANTSTWQVYYKNRQHLPFNFHLDDKKHIHTFKYLLQCWSWDHLVCLHSIKYFPVRHLQYFQPESTKSSTQKNDIKSTFNSKCKLTSGRTWTGFGHYERRIWQLNDCLTLTLGIAHIDSAGFIITCGTATHVPLQHDTTRILVLHVFLVCNDGTINQTIESRMAGRQSVMNQKEMVVTKFRVFSPHLSRLSTYVGREPQIWSL